MPQPPKVEIRVLGGFGVERGGAPVEPTAFGGRLAATLTRILVAHGGDVVSRDALCEMLWPEAPPSDPGANLNALVHRARHALGDGDLIRRTPGGYQLAADRCVIDAALFSERVAAARAEADADRAGAALRGFEAALALWHGDPIPEDAHADWAAAYRHALSGAHRQALESGAEVSLALGDVRRAADLAEQAVTASTLGEAAPRLLARARMAAGDRAGALDALDSLRDRLAEELGVDPAPETRELRLQVLRDELPAARSRGRPPALTGSGLLPFVGRHDELTRLLARTRRTHGGVALVAGRAGSGKSRLLAELGAAAGMPTLTVRAFLPERTTPWALARRLLGQAATWDSGAVRALTARARSALADLLPDVPAPDDGPGDRLEPGTRRALALEGALRLLGAATAGGALVVVDDLQWADASSAELLTSALHRLDGAVFTLAYRPDEIASSSASGLIGDVRASPEALEVHLGRLPPGAVAEVVHDDDLAGVLAAETDGSPFALEQVVAALDEEGLVRRGLAGGWRPVSPRAVERAGTLAREGMRRSLVARLSRQEETTRDLLACLALVGREAPAGLLAAATARPEPEVLETLDTLALSELVRLGDRGWTTAHDLIGATVADELTPAQRAAQHLRIAGALRAGWVTPGERARHLLGSGDRAAASAALATDAHEQLDAHADHEAARLADAALDLGPTDRHRVDLLEVRAQAQNRMGNLDASARDLREALAGCEEPPRRARILSGLAMLAVAADDLGHASERIELSLVEAGRDPVARARVLAVASVIDMNLERGNRAAERAREAEQLFRDLGDGHGVADVLDARAMAVFLGGHVRSGIQEFGRVARLYEDLGDLVRVITPRSTRGHGLLFAGEPEAGLVEADAALDVALDLGSPEGEAYVRWHRSEILSGCGRPDEALDDAEGARTLAERLGHRGWTATAYLACGLAHRGAGDLAAAEDAYRSSLATSNTLPLFTCWAHARLALVLIEEDRLGEAAAQVESARAHGPELGQYEARLAAARLAVTRRAPDAHTTTADALRRARAGGHQASAEILGRLTA